MRRIAVINQKGGVGKTTTCANLGAALARFGRRVVLVDLDAQANLAMHLAAEVAADEPSSYTVLTGRTPFAQALRDTATPGLRVVPSHLELSGAELELASTFGRETLMRVAVEDWIEGARKAGGAAPADYLIFDCPPSLGLPSINALAASSEVLIAMQTEFFALQGMSTLVDVVELLKRRVNPSLEITGILPCLYDARLRLAREVLAEIRTYFPGKVFRTAVRSNVKLAESPSFGQTIFEYAPSSPGSADYRRVAEEVLEQENYRPELRGLARGVWNGPLVLDGVPDPPDAADEEEQELVEHEPVVEIRPAAPPRAVPPAELPGEPRPVEPPRAFEARSQDPLRIPRLSEAAVEQTASPAPDPGAHMPALGPEAIDAHIERWVREAVTSSARAQPEALPDASPAPIPSPEPSPEPPSARGSRAEERPYVIQPSQSPQPRAYPALDQGPAPQQACDPRPRPNDLMSLCLRSLRSIWN
jgi:chromosome partitioning protein